VTSYFPYSSCGRLIRGAKAILCFSFVFITAQAQAQTQAQTAVSRKTAEAWGWSESGGYKSFGELQSAWNAIQLMNFAACALTVPHTCVKTLIEGVRFNPLYPQKINGDYLGFSVNATRYTENMDFNGQVTTTTEAANDSYAVQRLVFCPKDTPYLPEQVFSSVNVSTLTCVKRDQPPPFCPNSENGEKGDQSKSAGTGDPGQESNPIRIADGVKIEKHVDYASADGLLTVERKFLGQTLGWSMPGDVVAADLVSQGTAPFGLSENFNFTQIDQTTGQSTNRSISFDFPYIASTPNGELLAVNPDGSHTAYPADANGAFPINIDGTRVQRIVPPSPEGATWRMIRPNDTIKEFGADGRLRKVQLRNGRFVTYTYQSGKLAQMQDSFSRQLTFSYNSQGLLERVTLPDSTFVQYDYQNGLLSKVTYPDGKSRQFLYNEPQFAGNTPAPYSLTGTLDENNVRIGTYRYDDNHRAVSSESAQGLQKYTFQYGTGTTTVTPPTGSAYQYAMTHANGRTVLSSVSQPAGAGCGPASANLHYDANGNIDSRTDFNGNVTQYTYDATRNLEISRTEAFSTAQARTISTQWHPTYRIPTAIAEPLRRITFTHDAKGNVLTRTEQATTDANGSQSFNATLTGTARTWTYTYNDVGQVKTVKGPRTDINDLTGFNYNAQGNLVSVTNAAGHPTLLSNYDANGRVGRIVDPNGVTTDILYYPRGWLKQITVTDGGSTETTIYSRDDAGQLTSATLPGNVVLTYTYDPAHRLTDIQDNLGNKIHYVLDNMGNRLNEQVKDPGGNLTRQASRLYDALNRLQQVTGNTQ
jgi:YD repeat-containing protein